jgi:hypothetical protein
MPEVRTRSRRHLIKVRFDPDADGTLSLTAFLAQLDRLRAALYYTARDPADPDAHLTVRIRVLDLTHDTAFGVVADTAVFNGHPLSVPVAKQLVTNLAEFRTARPATGPPARLRDMDVLQAYQRLAEPVQKERTRQVTIAAGGRQVSITKGYVDRLAQVIGPDRRERGSVSGRLLRVNLYRTHRFDIFPSVGPRRIACLFKEAQRKAVIDAVGQYVTVEGTLKFKLWSDVPYAVDVERITPHDQSRLPTMADLRGMAQNALRSITSEEFIDSSREDDW